MRGTLSGRRQYASRADVRSASLMAIGRHADTFRTMRCASSTTATASTAAAPRACSRASTASGSRKGAGRGRLPRRSSTRDRRSRSRPTASTATRTRASTSATRRIRGSPGGSTTTRRRSSCPATRTTSAPTRPAASSTTRRRRAARSSSPTPSPRSSASTPAPLAELIEWAEIIDGALFPERADGGRAQGARAAPDDLHREQPRPGARRALHRRSGQPRRWRRSPPSRYVAEPLTPLLAQHQRNIETIRRRRRKLEGGVVFFDLADQETSALQQVHLLLPVPRGALLGGRDAGVAREDLDRLEPLGQVPRTHEITKICERYGGGGHPVVGAISHPGRASCRARARSPARSSPS